MKKKDVFISIIGTQFSDNDKDTSELYTNGIFYKDKDSYYISYNETETSGFKGCRTVVKASGDQKIIMMRNGAAQSHLIMENQKRCIGEYGLDGHSFSIGVTTEEIKNGLSDSGGVLFFRYQLDLNAQFLSTNEVTITVRDKE